MHAPNVNENTVVAHPDLPLLRLEKLHANLQRRSEHFLGYQFNSVFDYSALAPFLNMHLNNLGDPYSSACKTVHTREYEREVLAQFAQLWRAKGRHPLTPESYWGYVLSMGATEGTMFALWNARDYLSGKPLLHQTVWSTGDTPEPVIFCSEDTHYSIAKCASVLNMPTFYDLGSRNFPGLCPVTEDGNWPRAVASQDGVVDPKQLAELVDFFVARGHPPIIVLNIGSTFKGAYDDPQAVWPLLLRVFEKHGLSLGEGGGRQDYWIHVDGALGAGYLPYLELAHEKGLTDERGPLFDFRLPYVSSIVTSSHKWFGAPFPGGVYMSKEKFRLRPPSRPDYIGSPDSTFAGSRNGLSPLILWYALNTAPADVQAHAAARCARLADYAHQRLETVVERIPGFWVERSRRSLAVRFTRPRPRVFSRFGLSGEGTGAHIFTMPHVTRAVIDKLVDALTAPNALSLPKPT
ncbi:pyridoxal-dependent decarboxylase [Chelativorans sp. YIM 93263]|uniref:pyridoxal-dependent decarboxylase n=1 Tax=Chelativorans sp. YIM 93263 TaxID=2906648 RepID=UPI0023781A39|nr:pyridoxal-dependent decarboxylase [Chelativorans sp. YIM 93263]